MNWRSALRRLPVYAWKSLRQPPFALWPIRQVAATYNRSKFQADARAGLEVALLALPQGMAYALIAGLPVQYGLYASAVGAFVGSLFSSSRSMVLGPTNATAVLILSSYLAISDRVDKVASISLLLCLTGLFLILGAFFQLANLTRFISRSVVVGYITGAAFLIVAHQIHSALGFTLGKAATFFDVLLLTGSSLALTYWPALLMSLATFGCWWFLQRRYRQIPIVAVTLIILSVFSLGLDYLGFPVTKLTALPLGQWPVTFPEFNFTWFNQLVSIAFALAFLTTVEGTGMAKSLAARGGQRVDNNQEMFSYGMANVGCAFFGGMASSGSLTRSALNEASGAATPFSSLFSGVICALGLLVLGPLIGFIPVPALAVLVIIIGVSLVDWRQIRICCLSTRSDATVFGVTFLGALLVPLDVAIYLGVAFSIGLYLRKAGQPKLVEYTFDEDGDLKQKLRNEPPTVPHVSIIHVEGELFFGASELFREEMRRICQDPQVKVVILRLKNAHNIDASSVMALEELIRFLKEQGRYLLISGAERSIYRVLRNAGTVALLGKDNIFINSSFAPNVSTRHALLRAKKLLNISKATVRLFYDPQFSPRPPAVSSGADDYEI
jgi:sulfate permease, SulP family